MSTPQIHISGTPYFPGAATGTLHRGKQASDPNSLVLLTRDEAVSFTGPAAGIIVVDAAPFSHGTIGLLGLGRPTVLISSAQASQLKHANTLLIDGMQGLITSNLHHTIEQAVLMPDMEPGQPVLMANGAAVLLCASIRNAKTARTARITGAAAIGLVRTEFFATDYTSPPDTDAYLDYFLQICESAGKLAVCFRLLDIASDKLPSWLPPASSSGKPLGLNGVRMFENEPVRSVIRSQLAALSTVYSRHNISVLLPYIVGVEEFIYWKNIIRQYLPDTIPVGAMAETLASVLDIESLLTHADFIALGCNDLMQNLFSADRDDANLRHYLDPYAPVLYRLLADVANRANERLGSIQLCGLLSQIRGVLPVLLGLGFRRFSVDAAFIPYLAATVNECEEGDCVALAQQVCAARSSEDVLEILDLPAHLACRSYSNERAGHFTTVK